MQPPPVQYTRTSDGYDIAYTVGGEGPTLVYMPFSVQNIGRKPHEHGWGQNAQLPPLAAHVRLVRYDHRGQGVSTRGLGADHTVEGYERDLQAVLEQLGGERPVLMAGALSSHVAVRFAAKRPECVGGLILYRTGVTIASPAALDQRLAETDWNLFLHSLLTVVQANENISPQERREAIADMKTSIDQADWLQYARVAQRSSIARDARRVRVPTLVLATGGHLTIPQQGAAHVASLIPGAQLIYVDESAGLGGTVQPVLDFLASLPPISPPAIASPRSAAAADGLSPREVEVLRLVAAGRSSREIGEALVLSVRTVERHIANVYLKTETHGRAQVTNYARDNGLY
jgi:pimeloyl-ACP methyl ester carboxylesterase/DNA-binding CsgD family transcriptional regulator